MSYLIDTKFVSVHKPSLREKIFFLVSGIITSVPLTLFVNMFTDSLCITLPFLYAQICSIVIFAPIIEEFAKVYPLFYRHGESERSLFVLGFLVGFGFGFAEFLLYVFVYNQLWFVRLPAIFFHAASTSIIAYGIKTNRSWLFYLVAVGLHFIINFVALFPVLWWISSIALFIAYYLSWYFNKKTLESEKDV
jgi:hypothetical protein